MGPVLAGDVERGNGSLRAPQVGGHEAAVEYFAGGDHRAVEQIPVGCGKTGLIAILPFGIASGRAFVIAPNLTIRDQIAAAVDAPNPRHFYRTAAERALRHAVLWRKTSYATQTDHGDRLVERLLTLRETCRIPGRRLHEYLTAAITADLHGQPIPALLTPT